MEELMRRKEQWEQNTPDDEKKEELRQFMEKWEQNPKAIFDSFLRSFGSMIWNNQDEYRSPNLSRDDEIEDETVESDIELDDSDVVESDIELDDSDVVAPDNDPPQKMGDPSTEVTEEKQEAAQVSKSKAMDAISEGRLDDTIDHLTDAITLNPASAILYANRASIYIKLKKPNAAIRDADAALQINPDSTKGHKVRGIAKAMLGLWKEAASDLHVASALDFDEEIDVMLKKVEPNAKKIEDHHKKYLQLRKEKELRKAELERKSSQPKSQDAEAETLIKDEMGKINNHEEKEEGEDRLSKLPDPLILHILSLINYERDCSNQYRAKSQATKDVIRTSVLSKRWQFLWTGMSAIGFEERSKEMDKVSRFMSRVGDMLDKCSVSHLNRFCVAFYGDKCFSPNLDSWVQTAIERNVECIALYCYGWKSERSELPHMLYSHSSLTSLTVACWAMTPSETVNWKSVKSLAVADVNLSDCVMEKISSGCPVLEVLRLISCWGFTCLNILSPTFTKLEMVISHYTPTIDISAPYLRELKIEYARGKFGIVETEQVTQFRLREIKSLIRASLSFPQSTESTRVYMIELLQSLQHVEELELGNGCIKSLSESGGLNIPVSTRLRRLTLNLELKGSFHGIFCMLKSSPHIETLTIESSCCYSLGLEDNPEADKGIYNDLVFPNLKTINISLPRGDQVEALAQILLKSATVLQKMNLAFERFDYQQSEKRAKDLLAFPRSSAEAIVEVNHIEIW